MGNGPCFVSFEPNLVSLRRDLIASIRDTVENAIEHTRFCFEYRTIFDFRTKETRNDRERERKKWGKKKTYGSLPRREDWTPSLRHSSWSPKRSVHRAIARGEREKRDSARGRNDEQQANSLEEKEEEGRTGAALNVERHPFSSVASKRLTVPDCRSSRTVHDRSSKSNSVYTIYGGAACNTEPSARATPPH